MVDATLNHLGVQNCLSDFSYIFWALFEDLLVGELELEDDNFLPWPFPWADTCKIFGSGETVAFDMAGLTFLSICKGKPEFILLKQLK